MPESRPDADGEWIQSRVQTARRIKMLLDPIVQLTNGWINRATELRLHSMHDADANLRNETAGNLRAQRTKLTRGNRPTMRTR